jgi:hypothetical protein
LRAKRDADIDSPATSSRKASAASLPTSAAALARSAAPLQRIDRQPLGEVDSAEIAAAPSLSIQTVATVSPIASSPIATTFGQNAVS